MIEAVAVIAGIVVIATACAIGAIISVIADHDTRKDDHRINTNYNMDGNY